MTDTGFACTKKMYSRGAGVALKPVTEAVDDAENAVDKEAETSKFGEDLKTAFDNVEGMGKLFSCIGDATGPYSISGLAYAAGNCTEQSGSCASNLINTYVDTPIEQLGEFLQGVLSVAIVPPASTHVHSVEDVGDDLLKTLQAFANQPGLSPLACLVNDIVVPVYADIKAMGILKTTFAKWIAPVMAWSNKALNGTLVTQLYVDIETLVGGPNTSLGQILQAGETAAHQQCKSMMKASSAALQSYLKTVDEGTSPNAVPLIDTLLTTDFAGFAGATSAALVTAIGQVMDDIVITLVSPAIQTAVTATGNVLTAVGHAIDGSCGLIPEVGAAACAVINAALKAASSWVMHDLAETATRNIRSLLDDLTKYIANGVANVAETVVTDLTNATLHLENQFANLPNNPFAGIINAFIPVLAKMFPVASAAMLECFEYQKQWAKLVNLTQQALSKE